MAKSLVKQVSFKKSEIELFNAIADKDFSSYVKQLIRRDLSNIPPTSWIEYYSMYPKLKEQKEAKEKELDELESLKRFIMRDLSSTPLNQTKEQIEPKEKGLNDCFKVESERDEIDL